MQGIRSDRLPEELWTEVHDIVQEVVIKIIPKKKKCKMVEETHLHPSLHLCAQVDLAEQ